MQSAHEYGLTPAFQRLRLGEVVPQGWIRQQMLRDLETGFAGCLDRLCDEASSDIFISGRNQASAQNTRNELGVNWWNGETEGNWRTGHLMMSHLSRHARGIRKSTDFVHRILDSQDANGYLGIFAPELRFRNQGDLWTQACLLRGMLAYVELEGDVKVLRTIRNAVDLVVETFRTEGLTPVSSETHDLMICDVLEDLDFLETTPKYRDFALWLYQSWSNSQPAWDVSLPSLLDPDKPFLGHGVHTYENVRAPLWLATTTGREDLLRASRNALAKIRRYTQLSGSAVSQERIEDRSPDPSTTQYEYCVTRELMATMSSALQKFGDAAAADQIENLWLNAAQGARLPDGTAISYLTADNRFRCDGRTISGDGVQKRNKYSPTHSDVAVCCAPNATHVAALYVRAMWMRPANGGLAALLYGPATLRTKVCGVPIVIEESTSFPFDHSIHFKISSAEPIAFQISLRVPGWCRNTTVEAKGALIASDPQWVRVTKEWREGDSIDLTLHTEPEITKAINGEVAFRYGALLFALPLASKKKVLRPYPIAGFEDTGYELASPRRYLAVHPETDSINSIYQLTQGAADRQFPFDSPALTLSVGLIDVESKLPVEAKLIPLGSASLLRQTTFPVER